MTYRLEVKYASGGEPQVHEGLDADQADTGAGAFLRDLLSLEGAGVARLTIEAELPPPTPCAAKIWHGPGHQSSTACHVTGDHEIHEAIYGSDRQQARWRDRGYTDVLRKRGIEFDPESYPDNMAMSGFFDEPPEEPES